MNCLNTTYELLTPCGLESMWIKMSYGPSPPCQTLGFLFFLCWRTYDYFDMVIINITTSLPELQLSFLFLVLYVTCFAILCYLSFKRFFCVFVFFCLFDDVFHFWIIVCSLASWILLVFMNSWLSWNMSICCLDIYPKEIYNCL